MNEGRALDGVLLRPGIGGGVAVPGSAADRIVGAIRPGVRRGDAVYAAMT